ncbi:hypothetical protein D3C74_323300 [compost metagenome]
MNDIKITPIHIILIAVVAMFLTALLPGVAAGAKRIFIILEFITMFKILMKFE